MLDWADEVSGGGIDKKKARKSCEIWCLPCGSCHEPLETAGDTEAKRWVPEIMGPLAQVRSRGLRLVQ